VYVRILCGGWSTRVPAADRLSAGDKRSSREGVPQASGLGLPFKWLDAAPSAAGCRAGLPKAVRQSPVRAFGSSFAPDKCHEERPEYGFRYEPPKVVGIQAAYKPLDEKTYNNDSTYA
jgi:hypothetical protein